MFTCHDAPYLVVDWSVSRHFIIDLEYVLCWLCKCNDDFFVWSFEFQIYTNGYVTLDSNFESAKPSKLSKDDSYKMVAPFWADIDVKSDSKIWYHLYNKFGNADVTSILSETKALVKNNFRDTTVSESFEPNTVLVVTWENVVPSPQRFHKMEVEENDYYND